MTNAMMNCRYGSINVMRCLIRVLICIVHQGLVSVHRIVHCSNVVVLALVLYERLLLLLAIVVGSCEVSERVINSVNVHVSMYVSCHYD